MGTGSTFEASIFEIKKSMSEIRRRGKKVISNYYNQCDACVDSMTGWKNEKAIVFEYVEGGICHIYFYSVDEESLLEILKNTKAECVIDYITKDKDANKELFTSAGFVKYSEYGRFVVKEQSKEAREFWERLKSDKKLYEEIFNSPYGEKAKLSDAEEIDALLRDNFDPYSDHLYPIDKLRDYINRDWVWIAREDGKIVALYIFEIQGRKLYGAYIINKGSVNIMTTLLHKANKYILEMGTADYRYCWMDLTNKRALRYNVRFNGYTHDGLYDMIYIKR